MVYDKNLFAHMCIFTQGITAKSTILAFSNS